MDKKLRACTIGGGSGMPVVNRALVRAGFDNISSIVTTFDSGGDTGRMRTDERGSVLAFSDYWRSLISLWKDGKKRAVWEEMLSWRDEWSYFSEVARRDSSDGVTKREFFLVCIVV